jgi:hypothetical protein
MGTRSKIIICTYYNVAIPLEYEKYNGGGGHANM